jgi:metal-dependent amidase/aminoacylase/carboxypeptidase family protein
MNSEDFSFYAATVPGAVAWIGVRNEDAGIVHPLHDPRFAVDEAAIPLGTELLLGTATALMERPPVGGSHEPERSAHE